MILPEILFRYYHDHDITISDCPKFIRESAWIDVTSQASGWDHRDGLEGCGIKKKMRK